MISGKTNLFKESKDCGAKTPDNSATVFSIGGTSGYEALTIMSLMGDHSMPNWHLQDQI
jgi:hypothetical protein